MTDAKQPVQQEVLLGNGAVARGIVEAGCRVMAAYPGTPSSEILAEVIRFKKANSLDIYVEWSTNEKVALEVAIAASLTGMRAAAAMKQVGLNVASDALLSVAYTGVRGGLVVAVCDDPGPHSSQTEQDTRLFALFAKVPVFDPSTPREAKEMAAAAFALSEEYGVPVILRPTTRVCHATQPIAFGPIPQPDDKARFKKDPARWAATPRFRNILHHRLNDKLKAIEDAFTGSPFNYVEGPSSAGVGVIAGGVAFATAQEILRETGLAGEVKLLKIGTPYPLPQALVNEFMAGCEKVLVLEEPDYAIEMQIRDKSRLAGRLDGTVPAAGELTPEIIYDILTQFIGPDRPSLSPAPNGEWQQIAQTLELPVRKPRLCPGCSHRSSFYAIKRTFPRGVLPGDIGCYTLGLNLRAVDTVLDMGASVSMASGFYQAYHLGDQTMPIVATIGDSTFIHAGLPALANAVHNDARFILVILDNDTTAMTGMQPTAAADFTATGESARSVSIPELVKACGVKFIRRIDPYEIEDMEGLLDEARAYTLAPEGGVAVIVAERPCALYERQAVTPIKVEVTDECDGCRYCLVAFECPALVMNVGTDKVEIDRRLCIDCGECIDG
ncbi:MAG: indolepyruvate ferredoxin oxidoreductase subunit alpha, partial [Anaerolineae bacterium]